VQLCVTAAVEVDLQANRRATEGLLRWREGEMFNSASLGHGECMARQQRNLLLLLLEPSSAARQDVVMDCGFELDQPRYSEAMSSIWRGQERAN